MPTTQNTWQVWELPTAGGEPRLVTSDKQPDVHNFDACYLPDGRVLYCSTACFQGVPCVSGGDKVSLLYLLDRETSVVRQLTFDQDHSWDPTVMPDGRVVYTRWEYSDSPHYFTRLLFQMNPDGSNQREFYGSNSYWPNSMFYTRPVPGHPTQVATIVSGHHGERRAGELILLDPARGRREADGVVQRLLDRGQPVEPKIVDQLVAETWPKFLHPAPLSSKYYLAAARRADGESNAIYLVDTFDNLVLVRAEPGYHLFEPVPLQPMATPPVIPDRCAVADRRHGLHVADCLWPGPGLGRRSPGRGQAGYGVLRFPLCYNQMGGTSTSRRRAMGRAPDPGHGSGQGGGSARVHRAGQQRRSGSSRWSRGRALQVMRSWLYRHAGRAVELHRHATRVARTEPRRAGPPSPPRASPTCSRTGAAQPAGSASGAKSSRCSTASASLATTAGRGGRRSSTTASRAR